jgi:ABC-type nitrate/sulfonate/bicarbonate transport system substrate-binding protein
MRSGRGTDSKSGPKRETVGVRVRPARHDPQGSVLDRPAAFLRRRGSGSRVPLLRTAALLLAATLAASACGSAAAPAKPASSAPSPSPSGSSAQSASSSTAPAGGAATAASGAVTHITLCIPARTDTTLPAFAAQDAGMFAAQHISATLPFFAGQRVDAALVANQCDFALDAGAEGPVLKGFPARVVAVTTTKIPFQIWSQPSITSISQLKGKQIGTSSAGSLSYRVGNYLLEVNHLTPGKDVVDVPIANASATLAALVAGRVAAAVLSPPNTFQAKQQGMRLLYDAPPSAQLIMQSIVTTQSYLQAHPAVVTGVIKAVVQAMEKLRSDKAFYGQELARYTNLHLTPAQLTEYWNSDRQTYTRPRRSTSTSWPTRGWTCPSSTSCTRRERAPAARPAPPAPRPPAPARPAARPRSGAPSRSASRRGAPRPGPGPAGQERSRPAAPLVGGRRLIGRGIPPWSSMCTITSLHRSCSPACGPRRRPARAGW